jgi:hypothetical protein
MLKEDNITTIQVRKSTRDELKKLGIKGETYDTVIRRLLETAKKN